jgi:hypothetical protein
MTAGAYDFLAFALNIKTLILARPFGHKPLKMLAGIGFIKTVAFIL